MKASELKIGNYYSQFSFTEKVSWATLKKLEESTQTPLWCKPIILTEDIMIKFGFIYTEIHVGFNQFRKGILELSITPNGYEIFFTYKWVKIEYVHQLQNLYFALTGEELEVKQ